MPWLPSAGPPWLSAGDPLHAIRLLDRAVSPGSEAAGPGSSVALGTPVPCLYHEELGILPSPLPFLQGQVIKNTGRDSGITVIFIKTNYRDLVC